MHKRVREQIGASWLHDVFFGKYVHAQVLVAKFDEVGHRGFVGIPVAAPAVFEFGQFVGILGVGAGCGAALGNQQYQKQAARAECHGFGWFQFKHYWVFKVCKIWQAASAAVSVRRRVLPKVTI